MKKKFLISTALLIAVFALSASYSFATSNMVNTVENGAKNIASDVGGAISSGVGATKNTLENAGNMISNGAQNVTSGATGTTARTTTNATNTYTATKTSTANVKVAGMTATGWAWLIVGILGVAIVALVWFYGRQHETESYSSNNNNE